MKRTAIKVSTRKKCKWCGETFVIHTTTALPYCSYACQKAYLLSQDGQVSLQKAISKGVKKISETSNLTKESLKNKPYYEKKLQEYVNKICRAIDHDNFCISCHKRGKPQAGHYHSRGHDHSLRFNLHNLHIQCYRCNVQLHSNIIGFNRGLKIWYGEDYKQYVEEFMSKEFPTLKTTIIDIQEALEKAKELARTIEPKWLSPWARIKLREEMNQKIGLYDSPMMKNFTDGHFNEEPF